MKKILFLIIITVGIFNNVQAQIAHKARFEISSQDSSAKSFFDQHPNLHRIVIRYKNDKVLNVNLIYLTKQARSLQSELFDLTFEGDRYLLDKKYHNMPLPKPAKLTMQYLAGIPNLSKTKTDYDVETTLRRDSIIHNFSFYTSVGDNTYPEPNMSNHDKSKGDLSQFRKKQEQNVKQQNPNTIYDTVYFNGARFKGDVSQLKRILEQNFKQWKLIAIKDSVLLLSGIVEKNGSLGKLRLEIGDPSQFSKKISEVIEREATSWWPVIVSSGTKVRYKVKFFIRLNGDESLTISIL